MEIIETKLKDCVVIQPKRFGDSRGYYESFTRVELDKLGFKNLAQVAYSKSSKGTVRGLHFQKEPYTQAKVVRCHRGSVLDVVVDLRKDSPTYKEWLAEELTSENGKCLYVPRGFGHGFVALEDDTLFEYYVDNEYKPALEDGILYKDEDININWNEIFTKYGITNPLLSPKDENRHTLKECDLTFKVQPNKYLITGFKGQLGYDIVRELHNRGEYDIMALDVDQLDITDREKVFEVVKEYKPDVIFHCAAWTAVDRAEEAKELCTKVNVDGTRNMVDASIEVGAKIVYMSTDYIFDGTKEGLYEVEDKANPKSVYGQTKYDGENEVRRNPSHFITRISWVFGLNGNNFIKTMLKLADNHTELTVVNDQVGSPTYTVDLAKLLVEMAHTTKYGTYHVNNEGYCSWAEFAQYIMESNHRDCKIIPVSTEKYYEGKDMSKIAYRPRNSKLSKSKLEKEFYLLPSWKDATDRYCAELRLNKIIK